jgi:hypothetical protein
MQIKDLLSNLEAIEAHTTGNPANSLDSVDAGQVEVEVVPVVTTDMNIMVPPLQASLELLKRATDIPNFYNKEEELAASEDDYADEEETSGCGCEAPCDCDSAEISDIQRLAGVPMAAIFQAADQTAMF